MSKTYNTNVNNSIDENWVLYGKEGTLDSLEKRIDIRFYLKKYDRYLRVIDKPLERHLLQ